MNHRELVLSANKKARFGFLSLPEELQDEVIEGLDGQTLTLEGARDLLAARGHSLSHEAIAGYYRAVRRERRLYEATQELSRMFDMFADQPLEQNLRSFTNFLIADAARRLAEGEVALKIDLGKLIAAMARTAQPSLRAHDGPKPAEGEGAAPPGDRRGIDQDTLKMVREQIYGIA